MLVTYWSLPTYCRCCDFLHSFDFFAFFITVVGIRSQAAPIFLDGSSSDILPSAKIRLDGDWQFHWKSLMLDTTKESSLGRGALRVGCSYSWEGGYLVPGKGCPELSFSEQALKILQNQDSGVSVSLPHIWEPGDGGSDPSAIHPQGYALYTKEIYIPSGGLALSSLRGFAYSSARIWAFAGKKLYLLDEIGSPTSQDATTIPRITGTASFLPLEGDVTLVVEIANNLDRRGGFQEALYLGTYSRAVRERNIFYLSETFIAGLVWMAGMYHLLLFGLRRQLKSALSFGLFCLFVSLRVLLMSHEIPQLDGGFFSARLPLCLFSRVSRSERKCIPKIHFSAPRPETYSIFSLWPV